MAVVAMLAISGLGGCRDHAGPTSPGVAGTRGKASAAGMSHGHGRGLEEEGPLGRFAAENPAFGGWFFDGRGDLNVWVVDPRGRGASTRAAAAQAMASVPRDATEKQAYQVRVLPARYSFLQLSDWRDSLSTRFEAYPGLRWTDVDDVRNRVSASVESRRTRAMLRRDAVRMGIPAGALNVMSEPEQCTPDMLECNGDPCLNDPNAPGCGDPCSADPYAFGCEDPCSIDPNSPDCVDDPCVANPSDPACGPAEGSAPDTATYEIAGPSVLPLNTRVFWRTEC
ncbi:MAG: hypothetical protein AVDCRST_MAG68-865 [uncultured Gemmatimonadetes bacterium]|uniref:Uncharacterized protein n=1 Tax=uncultured Gemmatimonadota bacterium TaxID=203437 RepID=A0A6J4KLD8_9BACT|nr:MAG: hypothetical protein AVDCRST_MAG68-865 [uncultured Gemmatimonadota bacterium]